MNSLQVSQELFLRILSIPRTLLMYVRIILLPYDLHYYRSVDILQPYLPGIIYLIAVIIIALLFFRKMNGPCWRICLFSLGWFIIVLLPVLNIIPLINEYSLILTSDHFLYLPLFISVEIQANLIFN